MSDRGNRTYNSEFPTEGATYEELITTNNKRYDSSSKRK